MRIKTGAYSSSTIYGRLKAQQNTFIRARALISIRNAKAHMPCGGGGNKKIKTIQRLIEETEIGVRTTTVRLRLLIAHIHYCY